MEIVRTYEQELRYIERVATRVVLLFDSQNSGQYCKAYLTRP